MCLIKDFLSNRKQRVVLNGHCSSWIDVQAGVPQGSILGLLLSLIYIHDLPDNLVSNPKLFADDKLFSTVIQMLPQIRSIMIYITLVHGLTSGK